MDVESLILTGSYGAIFLLMIANGAISFPSSQLLYIVAGYFIAKGDLSWAPVIFVGAIGNMIGNIILYEAVRRYGRDVVFKWKLFDPTILAKVEVAVAKKGWWFLAIGKLLPAIKVFIPIPAGLGRMHRGGFAGIMLVASALWASVFLFFGYTFGKSFHIFGWYGVGITLFALAIVGLFFRYIDRISLSDSAQEPAKKSEPDNIQS
jgi:membrane protein DedA with SNARE-associated domain